MPAIEQWLHFTAQRHKAIANNLANVETPFYKTRDVPESDFRKVMPRAFDEQKRSPVGTFELERRDGILPKRGGGLTMPFVEADLENSGILRHIENNVDVDLEMSKMVKNGMLHNVLSNLLTQQFEQMREAISERVR